MTYSCTRIIEAAIEDHLVVAASLKSQIPKIEAIEREIVSSFIRGNRIYLMGNGGSAADAQHIAAELVGRFQMERRGFPAVALTTDTSILTAVANDYSYDQVFARQVEALVSRGDVLIGISTSGNSRNVLAAIEAGRSLGAVTIGLTGCSGGALKDLCDIAIVVPSPNTARIQEAHILVGHILCEMIDHVPVVRNEK